jgi:hypothetical protein
MPARKSGDTVGKQADKRAAEAPTSPPPTAIRRPDSLPRPETPQLSDASDDDARTAEEAAPTPSVRSQFSAQPPITPLQAPMALPEPSANAAATSQTFEAILQAQTNFLQAMERMITSAQASPASTHIHQKIQQLQEAARLVRFRYEKTKLASSHDWPRWNKNLHDYMTRLRISDILSEDYEIPISESPEKQLYDAQNTILQSFLRITVDPMYQYLLERLPTAREQYKALQAYLDLGKHAQIYYAVKELHTLKFSTYEASAASFTSLIRQIHDAGLTTIDDIAPYLFMAFISPYYSSAISNLLADPPPSLATSSWTLEAITRYFALQRPSRMPTQAEQGSKKSTKRQQRKKSATESEKQERPSSRAPTCATCGRTHRGVCFGRSRTKDPSGTDKQPDKVRNVRT